MHVYTFLVLRCNHGYINCSMCFTLFVSTFNSMVLLLVLLFKSGRVTSGAGAALVAPPPPLQRDSVPTHSMRCYTWPLQRDPSLPPPPFTDTYPFYAMLHMTVSREPVNSQGRDFSPFSAEGCSHVVTSETGVGSTAASVLVRGRGSFCDSPDKG